MNKAIALVAGAVVAGTILMGVNPTFSQNAMVEGEAAENAIAYRKATMRSMGGQLGAIGNVLQGKVPLWEPR